MQDIPRYRASLALIVRNGKLLLGHKIRKGATIGENTLNGPGGKCEGDQLARENLVQEVRDEVGMHVRAAREVAVIEFRNGTRSSMMVHVLIVTRWEGEPRPSDEMQEPADGWWHDIHALPFDRMLASDREWIPRLLAGERLMGTVEQDNDGHTLIRMSFQRY